MGSRILITGKNSTLPKAAMLPIGVGVDGTVIRTHITMQPHEALCSRCRGWGEIQTWDGNPSHRSVSERCEDCGGDGIVAHEVAA